MVIKPSGVSYDELTPETMVVCDLDGNLVEGEHAPSSDTAAHAYVYRHMPEVGGVVHTHSTYATAWAARGEPIPCVLTMVADEFGGDIPVGPFALIGDDSIGRGIVETLRASRSPRRADAEPRPVHDRQGRPRRGQGRRDGRGRRPHRAHRPPARRPGADRQHGTSTRSTTATRTSTASRPHRPARKDISMAEPTRVLWFLTGSQGLYGDDVLGQVADQSRTDRRRARRLGRGAGPVVAKPVLTDAGRDPPDDARGQRRRRLHRRHRLDAHVLPGQDVDQRAGPAAQAVAAPAHPGQRARCRGPTIDMDFMNLNQAAHGDREFGYVQTRLGVARKTVAGHVSDPRRRASASAPGRAPPPAAPSCRRMRLARFGDNMRNVAVTEGDKVEAERRFGVSVNTYGVNDLVDGRRRGRRTSEIDDLVAEYADLYDVVARAARRRRAARQSLRYGARIELGLRTFLDRRAASPRSPPTSRTSAGCGSCPASPCSG